MRIHIPLIWFFLFLLSIAVANMEIGIRELQYKTNLTVPYIIYHDGQSYQITVSAQSIEKVN